MVVDAAGFSLDPLIAEAKRRARHRRLLALLGLVVVAVAAVGTTFGLRAASANSLGVCASAPPDWKERIVANPALGPRTIVLTNFRFGRMENFYGLSAAIDWPANGVTVAVRNEGPTSSPRIGGALRVAAGTFTGFEGTKHPTGQVAIRSRGRILDAYVEVGAVTPATVAAANKALATVRTCSA